MRNGIQTHAAEAPSRPNQRESDPQSHAIAGSHAYAIAYSVPDPIGRDAYSHAATYRR
jgi:hypothetical protein